MNPYHCRLCIVLAVSAGWLPLLTAGDTKKSPDAKDVQLTGKVVPLADLLAKFGSKLDADAAAVSLALVADGGKVYPLIKDDGARMFFSDKSLQGRPMRLTGRLYANSNLLQVINVHSLKDGKLHDVYYWCEICIIKRYEKGKCDCCGYPMEFREVPVK